VPAFVVENSADDACTPSHGQRIWEALAHVPRERELIKGASHYYLGQRACLDQAADAIVSWLERQHFI
jgi:hypothetical protein